MILKKGFYVYDNYNKQQPKLPDEQKNSKPDPVCRHQTLCKAGIDVLKRRQEQSR